MRAKVSSRGLRFFAHDSEVPSCPAAGETPEHRWLKRRLAEAVRAAGWVAVVEAEPSALDVGGWRADVLGVSPGGRRVALEAQLAAMTVAVGEERTARYRTDGIDTVWVTTKGASWLYGIGGVQVTEDVDRAEPDGRGGLVVRRGCARLRDGDPARGWEAAPGVALTRLVDGVLAGRVVPHTLEFLSETLQVGSKERYYSHYDCVVLAGARQVEASRTYLTAAEARRAREAEAWQAREESARVRDGRDRARWADEEAQRGKHIEALYARQRELVPVVARHAADSAAAGEVVWLGVPPTAVKSGRGVSLEEALGNEKTAHGAVVWLGANKASLRLFAVVCPVASRIEGSGLARSWRQRGTRVYVADTKEAGRVARSLSWAVAELHVVQAADAAEPEGGV